MATPDPNSSSAAREAAVREQIMKRLLRDGVPPEKLAMELKVSVESIQRWKEDYLRRLQTANKSTPPRTEKPAPTTGPVVVNDLNNQHPRTPIPKPKPMEPEVVKFPLPADPRASLNQDERHKLERTQRLIIEQGKITVDVGRKIGMLPNKMYEAPQAPDGSATDGAPFAFNHGISEKSQASFARNWERLGSDAKPGEPRQVRNPDQPIPQGVRLSDVEKFSFKLQDLPGLSWVLRGGKTDAAPWLILAMCLVVAGVTYVLWSKYSAAPPSSPGNEARSAVHRIYDAAEREARDAMVLQFFQARTIDDLLPLIRHPEIMRPIMMRFYAVNPLRPKEVKSVRYLDRGFVGEQGYTIHGVRFPDRGSDWPVHVLDTPEGPRIDWETAAGYRPISWKDFQFNRYADPVHYRVQVRRTDFHDLPFMDDTVWRAFRLEHPEETKWFYGYAEIGSPVEKRLMKLLEDESAMCEVILTIRRPPTTASIRDEMVQIIEPIVSEHWVVDYKPGQRHFDLPEPKPATANEKPTEPKPTPPANETAPPAPEAPPPTPAVETPAKPETPAVNPPPSAEAPPPKPEEKTPVLPPKATAIAAPPAPVIQPSALTSTPPAPKPTPAKQAAPKPKPTSTKPKSAAKPTTTRPSSPTAKPKAKPAARSTNQSRSAAPKRNA